MKEEEKRHRYHEEWAHEIQGIAFISYKKRTYLGYY